MNAHLDEVYGPDGSAADKLRGLIHCIRERKTVGYEREAIAARAMLTLPSVTAIVGGQFNGIRWDSVDALLRAIDAKPAEIAVALQLYEKAQKTSLKPTYGPRRLEGPRRPYAVLGHTDTTVPTMANLLSAIDRETKGLQEALAPLITEPPSPAGPVSRPPVEDTDSISVVMMQTNTEAMKKESSSKKSPTEQKKTMERVEDNNEKENTDDSVEERQGREENDVLVPRPEDVETVQDLINGVVALRTRYGRKPYRKMAKLCTQRNAELKAAGQPTVEHYSIGSFSNLIQDGRKGKLPSKGLLRAYIAGAGGDLDDLKRWTHARNRLEIKALSDDPSPD